jgi:PTH1 family peptidyl-tRNA hydrolase
MKLIVGLGNPGEKHARNRHNVGFMALDRIWAAHGFGPWKRKFHALAADGEIGGEKVLLLKPQTYMNESGRSVGEAARFLKIPVGDIVVLYDEIDLAPGKLKAKVGGGNAGHNGLRSISAHLDNDYVRVRIGIGHPGRKELVAGYVLHDFARADETWLDPLLDAIAACAGRLAEGNPERFLTDVAKRLAPPRSAKPKSATEAAEDRDSDKGGAPGRVASARHPAGERAQKRESALAENLRKWLSGRRKDDGGA